MAMCGVGPLDLTSQVDDGHELLGAGRQIAQADIATTELIAEDHREVGAVACSRLELLAEFAPPELCASGPGSSLPAGVRGKRKFS